MPLGFKRKNLAWNRRRGEFVDIITLQKAKYSTPTEQSITGNVAICVPEFREIIFGEIPAFLIEADGMFTVRFGALAANDLSGRALDRWWNVSDETADAVASELADIVKEKVVPFLNSYTDFAELERLLNTLTGWQTKTPYFQLNKAMLYWKLGNHSKCDEILSSVNKWPEQVERVREWVKKHK
jgi:hypothetical protein